MRRAARIVLLAGGAALWLAAAWLLLATDVPSGLDLPAVDVDAVFGAEVVDDAERFERVLLWLWAGSQAALLATLVLYARHGARFTRESAAGRVGTGMLLGMLGLGLVWLAQLPFDVASFWWLRRHDLVEGGLVAYVLGDYLQLGTVFLLACVALLVVMALAGVLGERWWLPGAAVFVGLGALFALVSPYLTTDLRRIDDPELRRAVTEYERELGVTGIPVRIEEVSDETSQPNAYAFGVGPTRRVVLWDTLVDEYPPAEVRVVLAHELAHHSGDHIAKAVGWFALIAIPGAWVLMRVTRRRGGLARPEAVPLALLAVVAIQLAVLPVTSWVSRRMEAEADWKALQATRDPDAARDLFRGFAVDSLGDPDPPAWASVLLGSHPTLEQRVAMAEAWRARQDERVPD